MVIKRLRPGALHGHVTKGLAVADFVLTESTFEPHSSLPRHSHENSYFCFSLQGVYTERYGKREVVCRPAAAPTVAVFIENVPRRRLFDLVASDQFADFMAKELVPWIRSHYHVTKDPKQTVLSGYSAGGLAAPFVALRHPEVFGNVVSLSGAFWWSFEHNGGVCGSRCPESGGRGGDGSRDTTTEGNFLVKQFSRVRSCHCVSILRREHLNTTVRVEVARFWKARATCVMCYWQKAIRFTISNSSAATMV